MPASLPGSTLAQNKANPSLGAFVIFDPLSGPLGSPLDKDLPGANQCSTGALSTGIGFSAQPVIGPRTGLTAPQAIDEAGFIDNQTPGTESPNDGTQNVVNSTQMYIGGGKCTANVGGVAPAVPYTAGIAIAGAGNSGSRDGGVGPAFTGFALKMVTAIGSVANGVAIEAGFINRSGVTMIAGQSAHGSATATLGAASQVVLSSPPIAFDANGRIRNTVAAPAVFVAGVPFSAAGLLCLVAAAVDHHHNGQPYVAAGQLAVQSAVPDHFAQGGLPIAAGGGIAIAAGDVIDHHHAGLPYTAAGALVTAVPE